MTLFRSGLIAAALMSLTAAPALAQEAPRVSDEQGFIGHTWSGGSDMILPGFEGRGGAMIGPLVGVHYFQSVSDPREWALVSMLEIGRVGSHALWRGVDAARHVSTYQEGYIGFACHAGEWPQDESAPDTPIIGVVGGDLVVDTGEMGLLAASGAWTVSPEGELTAVEEPVTCIDEGYGV